MASIPMDELHDFSKPIRSVRKLSPVDHYLAGSWEALGAGAPVLVALAQLTAQAMVDKPTIGLEQLLPEAKAILFAAHFRGIIEIKGSHTAFDAPARMLAVYIELDDVQCITFRDPESPEITVRFLEGFRELCVAGLVMHHTHRDFSLTTKGFTLARTIAKEDVQPWLDLGREFGLHD